MCMKKIDMIRYIFILSISHYCDCDVRIARSKVVLVDIVDMIYI